MRRLLGAAILIGTLPAGATEPPATSCVACHGSAEWFDEEGRAIVAAFGDDVHARAGLSCNDCHGGDPSPELREDLDRAMDPAYPAAPYRGAPRREEVPAFCGRCHSDPTFMRRFDPAARVDQEAEYRSSHHGAALARGDTAVATCVDCHGAHGIRGPSDPASPVHPTRVAETCRGCHADPERMAGRSLADGRPFPIDQYARWRRSVHAAALLEREDLSAPTCNDCHGNHGAAPPGLASIGFVCGQCHGREAELFRASAKHDLLADHAGLMEGLEAEGCGACHEAPEPQAELVGAHLLSECTSCHDNHGVVRASLAMLGPLPETPCAFCHEGPDALDEAGAEPEPARRRYEALRDELMASAASRGLAGLERFDWLVQQAPGLPPHTEPAETTGSRGQRPEFARLFQKFRLGATSYVYEDPVTGEPTRAAIVRCTRCHAAEPVLADRPAGLETAAGLVDGIRGVTALTARAERLSLQARRGGVETQAAQAALDRAVDAGVELEVLVHTFDVAPESAFARRRDEGVAEARAAVASGRAALAELTYRRRGLAVFLGIVVLMLVALGAQIRRVGS